MLLYFGYLANCADSGRDLNGCTWRGSWAAPTGATPCPDGAGVLALVVGRVGQRLRLCDVESALMNDPTT